jgi:hypothetical protein
MAPLADALLTVIPKEWHLPAHLTAYYPGVTPLSTVPVVVACLIGYLGTIFGLREFMRGREPMKLTTLFQFHNVYLTAGSGLLLVLMVEEILPIWWKGGLFTAMCADDSWTSVRIPLFSIALDVFFSSVLDGLVDAAARVFVSARISRSPTRPRAVFSHGACIITREYGYSRAFSFFRGSSFTT